MSFSKILGFYRMVAFFSASVAALFLVTSAAAFLFQAGYLPVGDGPFVTFLMALNIVAYVVPGVLIAAFSFALQRFEPKLPVESE